MKISKRYKNMKIGSIIGISLSCPLIITGSLFIGLNINKKATLVVNSLDSVDQPLESIEEGIGMLNYGYYYSWYRTDQITREYREATPKELEMRNRIIEDTKGTYLDFINSFKPLKEKFEKELNSNIIDTAKEQRIRRINFINEVQSTYAMTISGFVLLPLSIIALLTSIGVLVYIIIKNKNPKTVVVNSSNVKLVMKKSNELDEIKKSEEFDE